MALTLCTRVEDGWEFDYEEDLSLTPTPRDEIDWTQLPEEVVKLILLFVDEANIHYWSEITEQKSFSLSIGVVKPQDVSFVEYHMNKRLTLKQLGHQQSIGLWQVGRNPHYGMTIEEWDRLGRPRHDIDFWTQEDSDDPKNTFSGRQVSMMMKKLNHRSVFQKPYKVKVIKKAKSKCSLCGKVGHNKNNRKFH